MPDLAGAQVFSQSGCNGCHGDAQHATPFADTSGSTATSGAIANGAMNLTKSKKLTNMRASGSDDKVRLAPPIKFSLEEALEYIQKDEYVEVTPKSIRLRKIMLNENDRKRSAKKVV